MSFSAWVVWRESINAKSSHLCWVQLHMVRRSSWASETSSTGIHSTPRLSNNAPAPVFGSCRLGTVTNRKFWRSSPQKRRPPSAAIPWGAVASWQSSPTTTIASSCARSKSMEVSAKCTCETPAERPHVCTYQTYRKIPCIWPPFDAQKFMPKIGGGLTGEDLTFGVKVKSKIEQVQKRVGWVQGAVKFSYNSEITIIFVWQISIYI